MAALQVAVSLNDSFDLFFLSILSHKINILLLLLLLLMFEDITVYSPPLAPSREHRGHKAIVVTDGM